MHPAIERARKILLHEQRIGHTDQAVKPGGLEAFITRWSATVAGEQPPLDRERLQNLARLFVGYRALDPMQRAARVRAGLAALETLTAAPTSAAKGAHTAPTAPAVTRTRPVSASRQRDPSPDPWPLATPPPDLSTLTPSPKASMTVSVSAGDEQAPPTGPSGPAQYSGPAGPSRPQGPESPSSAEREAYPLRPSASSAVNHPAFPPPASSAIGAASRLPQGESLLDAPVTVIPGLGPTQAARLERLGLRTIHDLLRYFPREHRDYSKLQRIGEIPLNEVATIMGMIWEVSNTRSSGGRVRTTARISDQTGQIRAIWFNQPYLTRYLTKGSWIVLTGVKQRFGNKIEFSVRSHELPEQGDLINTGRIVPVYPLTEGLSDKALRRYTKWAVDRCAAFLPDYLPITVRRRADLLPLPEAVAQYHYPDNQPVLERARRRLAFDELFLIQLGMLARRAEWQSDRAEQTFAVHPGLIFADDSPPPAPPVPPNTGLWPIARRPFEATLPFRFTGAQRLVLTQILQDLAHPQPMCRLLQGDVGSGKTVVAAAALLAVASHGYQGVLMAPTEILAEQHARTISRLLEPFGIQTALLTGSLRTAQKQQARRAVESGAALVAVGTHALIQDEILFRRLGLVIVDEQHRFGVAQRDALRQKGYHPHMLVMSATPIPRTLALTLYGDLDVSVIDELPAGRQRIITRWRAGARRQEAYDLVAEEVAQGRQAFVICPLIEESESLEAKAATVEYERLRSQIFPHLRLGLLHGALKPAEKDAVMRRFRDGELDVLVATAVVEVGIDVPNTTVMIIEDADRFGLSQLHQFRGRVGRGAHQSYCYLLSEETSAAARERLTILEATEDGFALAEADLKLRGPGDFFGTRQSGLPELRVAHLADILLLTTAREQAQWLWQQDPHLRLLEHAPLRAQVATFWQQFINH
jgi:ATP-dependent DNA helicase RecG